LEASSNDPQISNVIAWLPCGTAFSISDQLAFSHTVLPVHFASMHSFKSFRRQLNLYGFKKQYNRQSGKREVTGAYGHPLFLRGRIDLAMKISRAPSTSKKTKKRSQQASQGMMKLQKGHADKGIAFMINRSNNQSSKDDTRKKFNADSISMILFELEQNDIVQSKAKHEQEEGSLPRDILSDCKREVTMSHDNRDLDHYHAQLMDSASSTSSSLSSSSSSSSSTSSMVVIEPQELDSVPYSLGMEVDNDDIRTEIIRTFLW